MARLHWGALPDTGAWPAASGRLPLLMRMRCLMGHLLSTLLPLLLLLEAIAS